MTPPKQYKTKSVNESDYIIFIKKAKEFYQTMYQAEKAENWNAVGLNGVHCIISLIDAILVKYSGIRSGETDHMVVVKLLTSSLGSKINDLSQKSQSARRIIAKKNLIEYENRDFIKSEALDMIKQVQRFYEWAVKQVS
jgi:hypothetical protein